VRIGCNLGASALGGKWAAHSGTNERKEKKRGECRKEKHTLNVKVLCKQLPAH